MFDKSPKGGFKRPTDTTNPLEVARAAQAQQVEKMKPRRTKIGPKAARVHRQHRKAGRTFAPVGLGQFTGQNAGTEEIAVTVDSPLFGARLCIRDAGGDAQYIDYIKVDGKTVYTGTKLSVDVLKVPANEPATSKTVGYRVGDVNKSIAVKLYFGAVAPVELWANAYVDNGLANAVDNDDEDDDSDDEE